MEIKIRNCNNIKSADITIEEGKLNIKYGVNGTGKTTIAKAIELAIKPGDKKKNLEVLRTFGTKPGQGLDPTVEVPDSIKSLMVFNQDYIDQFVFRPDELVANSFEIFIKDAGYDEREEKFNQRIDVIRKTFEDNEKINKAVTDFENFLKCFGEAKAGYHKRATLYQAIGAGNPLQTIPEELQAYEPFLKLDKSRNAKWLKWQQEGDKYIVDNDGNQIHNCPYCVSSTAENQDRIQGVKENYSSIMVENLTKLFNVWENLRGYFQSCARQNIEELLNNREGLTDENLSDLVDAKDHVKILFTKLKNLGNLSFFNLKDAKNCTAQICQMKIDLGELSHLNSDQTEQLVGPINVALEKVLEEAAQLKENFDKHKAEIVTTIQKQERGINHFLRYAGYRYHVSVAQQDFKMLLCANETSTSINSKQHLSHGEKNAFALVIFMFEAVSNNVGLIVLDDPVSSFDQHKKYAIIERLFGDGKAYSQDPDRTSNEATLRKKTVFMLTHDFEPVVDTLCAISGQYLEVTCASLLVNDDGVLTEKSIAKKDIKSIGQVCLENIGTQSICGLNSDLIDLVYLRRYFEIVQQRNEGYQILSDLLHGRGMDKVGKKGNLDDYGIEKGILQIREHIPHFGYDDFLGSLKDPAKLCDLYFNLTSNYEKLQVYRLIAPRNKETIKNLGFDRIQGHNVVHKFINETYHIENDAVMQLNPREYNLIPKYIMDICDKKVAEFREKQQVISN